MSIIVNNPTRSVSINQNYFKNAAFNVIQGSTSGTVSNSLSVPTASLGYPGETEWAIAASGNSPAYAFSSVNQSLTLTGAASTTAIHVLQRIESVDAIRLSLKTVTLSVELSNSLLTTVTWELFRPTTTANVHGTISSPTQTLIAAGSWTVTSTLTRYSTTVTLPTEVSNGLEVRIRVGAQTSGTWVIARPKLEEGSVATAFVCEDAAIELTKCQRYFRNLSNHFYGYYSSAGTISTEVLHLGMFGSSRVRNIISESRNNAFVVLTDGINADATRVNYTLTGINAPANAGANPIFTVAAHIP